MYESKKTNKRNRKFWSFILKTVFELEKTDLGNQKYLHGFILSLDARESLNMHHLPNQRNRTDPFS